jgi:hypothetical protein
MTQQDALLSSLLKSEQRRPVDVNLGQVPITPTIGRMGNYSVVTRETLKDNPASELSRALSQLPQLLGQAKNISVAAGLKQAEEMDLEEIEKRWNNGDTEAEGFMTWLGGNKAFQEAAYQRLFDASIKPNLQKVSSEIDGMTNGELLQFDSDESIKEYAQSRLVGSLAPGILDTVRTNSWLAVRHNRAMEAIIPNYVQKAAASIDARKRDFQEKEALAAVETNFLTQAETPIQTEYIVPEFANPDDPRVQIERELFDQDAANQRWVDNLQYSLDFATDNGFAGRLDKFQIEAQLIPALTAKYRMLIEDEDHSAADLFLEAMESGSLNINGRPINKSSAGMRLIQNAEALLEDALEADEGKIDTKKIDSHNSDLLSMIAAEKVKPGYDPDTFAGSLQEMEDEVLNDPTKKWNDKEKISLSNTYARARDGLYGRGEIHAETSDEKREELGEEIQKKFNLSAREQADMTTNLDIIESATIDTGASLSDYKNYITKEVNDGVNPVYEEFRDPILKILTANALQQAVKETVGSVVDLPENELFLGTYKTDEEQKNQSLFRNGLQNTLQERYKRNVGLYVKDYIDRIKSQNPPLSDEEKRKQQTEDELHALDEAQYYESARDGSVIVNEDGKLTPDVSTGSINRGSVYASGAGFDTRPRASVTKYDINKVNRTLANEYGREAVKGNPVNQRIKLINSLVREASNKGRRNFIGKRMASVYKTDAFDQEVTNELDVVRNSGLPLDVLIKDGGNVSGTYRTGGVLGLFTDENKYVIPYNYFDTFNKPEETKKRIFNMGAVTKYIKTGDSSDLEKIRAIYLPSMPLEDLIKNQVTFFESLFGDITK